MRYKLACWETIKIGDMVACYQDGDIDVVVKIGPVEFQSGSLSYRKFYVIKVPS